MSFHTLLKFLLGRRDAILHIAGHRHTRWLGILWVLGAALARRYDRADLLAEPWHLVMPLAVSWLNGSILFGLLWLTLIRKAEDRPRVFDAYRVVLGCFWMTAPLAWLYAVPVERFLSPYDATLVNLCFLLIVATWRILLYARIVAVLLGKGFSTGFWVTMLFGDAVLVTFMILSPKPMLAVMGGMMHTPQDVLLLDVTAGVLIAGILSMVVWLIGTLVTVWRVTPQWRVSVVPESSDRGWILPVLGLIMWLPILPFTQPEQRLAGQVDRHLIKGRLGAAVDLMVAHELEEFPPHFNPRPKLWRHQDTPSAWLVLDEMTDKDVPEWALQLYFDKAEQELGSPFLGDLSGDWWWDAPRIEAMTRVLSHYPQLAELKVKAQGEAYGVLGYQQRALSKPAEAALEALVALPTGTDAPAAQREPDENE